MQQSPLKDVPLERIDAAAAGMKYFMAMSQGKEANHQDVELFYKELCKGIAAERIRLGGDWAVAMAVPTRQHRDMIKDILGPDLVFVILGMTRDTTLKRLQARHGGGLEEGGFGFVDALIKFYDIYEPAGHNEINAIDIAIEPEMKPEDVVDNILNQLKDYPKKFEKKWKRAPRLVSIEENGQMTVYKCETNLSEESKKLGHYKDLVQLKAS